MEGFNISEMSGDLQSVLEDIEAKAPSGDHDDDDDGEVEHGTEDSTQGVSDHDTNKDGSREWVPEGQSSKKQTSGQPASPRKEAFSLALSSDLGNLNLSVIVSKPPVRETCHCPPFN